MDPLKKAKLKIISEWTMDNYSFSVPEPEYREPGEPCDHFLIPEVNDEDHTLDFHIGGD